MTSTRPAAIRRVLKLINHKREIIAKELLLLDKLETALKHELEKSR